MERGDHKTAALEQAKLAQAKGDKATVNKLRKELLELNLQIFNDNKWMFEQEAQDQMPVVTGKQEDLRSTQIRTSEKETSEFWEQIDVLFAQIRSLRGKRATGVNKPKYIQPYVEDDNQEEQNTTRQGERQESGRRGENVAELRALDESDKGDKGFKCEMSGALGDLNISDSTITHKIPGIPTSDDLDRLVYDAGDRRKPGPNPRVTGYGCTTFHPKTSGKIVNRANVGPWWLGVEGFEKCTSQWLELVDAMERRRLATMEMEGRESQRSYSEGAPSAPQHSCSCGDTCSVVEEAEIHKRLYEEDSLIEEEDAEHRGELFQKEHEFLTRTILATLRKLEDGVKDAVEIKLWNVDWLRLILALAKGKSQDNDPYEQECSLRSEEDYSDFTSLETYYQLETYYRYLRRHQHLEIDSHVLDLTKKLLTMADKQEIALRAEILRRSKHYEERVQNGEEIKTNMLVYLKKLLRFAGDKNVEDDAEIAGEESELEDGQSNDPTDIFISYLKMYLDSLDYVINGDSQIEVDAELLGVARRVIERVASTEQQKPKDQQHNKPRVVIQYVIIASDGKTYKGERILDHVVENEDGTVTCSAEECEGINSSIICWEDILNSSQNWLDVAREQSRNKQPQKPWFVITHSVKTNLGNILSDKQLLVFECILNNGLASMTGGTSTFPRCVVISNKVHVERDERIVCRAKFLLIQGEP